MWRVGCNTRRTAQRNAKHVACIEWIDNPVIIKPRRKPVGRGFVFGLCTHPVAEFLHGSVAEVGVIAAHLGQLDIAERARGLFGAHHPHLCVGP